MPSSCPLQDSRAVCSLCFAWRDFPPSGLLPAAQLVRVCAVHAIQKSWPTFPSFQSIPLTNLFSSQHLLLFQLMLLICLLISHLLLSLALSFFKTGHGVLLLWQPQTGCRRRWVSTEKRRHVGSPCGSLPPPQHCQIVPERGSEVVYSYIDNAK